MAGAGSESATLYPCHLAVSSCHREAQSSAPAQGPCETWAPELEDNLKSA